MLGPHGPLTRDIHRRIAGTCVNNEYVVQFKKGAFEMGAVVCPIAIKYKYVCVPINFPMIVISCFIDKTHFND